MDQSQLRNMTIHLRNITGVDLKTCKKAVKYSNGNMNLAVAYIKSEFLAVATPGLTKDERIMTFLEKEE